ncbi:trm112p-like protein, partial [Metarhizium majus ARSEF 297]
MKVLSLNFLTCAAKACKSSSDSYPLHPKDAELVQDEIELNPDMIINVLPRLDWAALRTTSSEVRCSLFFRQLLWGIFVAAGRRETWVLGFPALPEQPPTAEELQADEKTLKDLHHLLLETQMSEGKLVCANCGHEYAVKEGIANFLLPSHMV